MSTSLQIPSRRHEVSTAEWHLRVDLADAFLSMYLFETGCTIQVRAQSGGGELVTVDPRIVATARQQAREVTHGLGANLTWPGLLRRLQRRSPGFDA